MVEWVVQKSLKTPLRNIKMAPKVIFYWLRVAGRLDYIMHLCTSTDSEENWVFPMQLGEFVFEVESLDR